jgi:lauroyl/myristoyl acyltransferase
VSREDLAVDRTIKSDAVDNGGVASAPVGGETVVGEGTSRRLRPALRARGERQLKPRTLRRRKEVPTKAFEAPHKREKETFLTHLAGLTLLSFWKTSSWLLGHLPPGPAYRVGGWIAMIGYAAGPQRRRWLRSNFGHVLGVSPNDKAAGRMARKAYRNYARYVMELMRLPWLKPGEIDLQIDMGDFQRFLDIYHNANGVILVAAHLGNNEAAASAFAKHGLEINVVGDDSSYVELFELFERQRTSWGIKMITWRNLRGVYSVLRRKEALVLLVDWGYRADGVPVKMFGSWTTLPAGPALLAARHCSTILPICVNRLADGRFRVTADDPITVPSDSPADLAVATQKIADALEGHIAPAPEQWYIFKPIWPLTAAEAAALEARHAETMAGRDGAANGMNGGDGTTPTAGDGSGPATG